MRAKIRLGHKEYVLPVQDALKIMEILEGAPLYNEQYHRSEGDVGSYYTYHIWESEKTGESLELIPENTYRIAKLAGKYTEA
jgi:hypothetical protein|tara:strand:+ start:23 stop:268 length:246 start_codon:yes stop_codon:yes gene_type:complete